jgi:hypothetical protein
MTEAAMPKLRRAWTSSVAFKLELAFAIIVALTGSAIVLAILRLDDLARVVDSVTGQNLPAVTKSLNAAADTADVNPRRRSSHRLPTSAPAAPVPRACSSRWPSCAIRLRNCRLFPTRRRASA